MRDSLRSKDERARIAAAIAELAIATRDHSIDMAVIKVYMPNLDAYAVEIVETACEALHAAEWFPKVGELVGACKSELRRREGAERHRLIESAPPPRFVDTLLSPERHAELMAKLKRAAVSGRGMP